MKPVLLALLATVSVAACNREIRYQPNPDAGSYQRTDSSMIQHENPANKSSTGVGIPGY